MNRDHHRYTRLGRVVRFGPHDNRADLPLQVGRQAIYRLFLFGVEGIMAGVALEMGHDLGGAAVALYFANVVDSGLLLRPR